MEWAGLEAMVRNLGFSEDSGKRQTNSDSGLPVSFWDHQCPQQDQAVYFEIHPPAPAPP